MQGRELLSYHGLQVVYHGLQEDLVAHFLTYLSVVSTYLQAIYRLVFSDNPIHRVIQRSAV